MIRVVGCVGIDDGDLVLLGQVCRAEVIARVDHHAVGRLNILVVVVLNRTRKGRVSFADVKRGASEVCFALA